MNEVALTKLELIKRRNDYNYSILTIGKDEYKIITRHTAPSDFIDNKYNFLTEIKNGENVIQIKEYKFFPTFETRKNFINSFIKKVGNNE